MLTEREITLAEWVGELPDSHSAKAEYRKLVDGPKKQIQALNDEIARVQALADGATNYDLKARLAAVLFGLRKAKGILGVE